MAKRKYPAWSYFAATIAGFCLLIAVFLISFKLTVFDRNFAHSELEKYEVSQKTGVSREEINQLFDVMLEYLKDEREDMQIQVTQNGVRQDAYSEKELLHMVDVKGLFTAGFRILDGCILVSAVLIVLLCLVRVQGKHISRVLARGFLIASAVFVVLVGGLGAAIALDFDHAFILFHKLFFTNDLWQLNYATDLLMNIVPETYSFDVAARTVIIFAAGFAVLILLALVFRKERRRSG